MNRKYLAFISIVLAIVSLFSIAAYATDDTNQPQAAVEEMTTPLSTKSGTVRSRHKTGSANFESDWETHTTYLYNGITIGVMRWGFNEFATDEDYSYTYGANNNNSQSYVYRNGSDSSYNYGPYKIANIWSRVEVPHKTDDVYYGIYLSGTYTSNVTYEDS